jgi:hypothetical protein
MVPEPFGIRCQLNVAPGLAILMLIGIAGCDTSQGPVGSSRQELAAQGIKSDSLPDHSLPHEEYVRAGMPPDDRTWYADDMFHAERVLTTLTQDGYKALPRYHSPRSGTIFARLTSVENLLRFRNKALPLHSRFYDAQDYCESFSHIALMYLAAFQNTDVRDSEVVEVMGALFRIAVVLCEMVDEVLPLLDPDAPTYDARMKGLATMERGLAKVVVGGLDLLDEAAHNRAGARGRLLAYMQETFPILVPHLAPEARDAAIRRMEQMQESDALRVLQPQLDELLATIRGAVLTFRHDKSAAADTLQPISISDLGFSRTGDNAVDLKMHRTATGEPDGDGWCSAASTEGGFSVSLPNRFNDFTITAKAKDGVDIRIFVVGTRDKRRVKFTAAAISRPDGKFIGDLMEQFVETFRNQGLKDSKPVARFGMQGTEMIVSTPTSYAVMRFYRGPKTAYEIIVEAPSSIRPKELAADIQRFMESFTLVATDES